MEIKVTYDSTVPEDQVWLIDLRTGTIHKIINIKTDKQLELDFGEKDD